LDGGNGNAEHRREDRQYVLNEDRSMKKKLKSTEFEPITIQETKGGTRFLLNTGTYEILKNATRKYFFDNTQNYTYTYIPVNDKKSNEVELKFKVADGKTHLYTLNMYNTTSSCLINGKNPQHFFNTDLPNILELMESTLVLNDETLSGINQKMKQQIQSKRQGIRHIILRKKVVSLWN